MKQGSQRLLICLLALVLVLPMLAACGEKGNTPSDVTQSGDDSGSTEVTESPYRDDITQKFPNETVNIVSRSLEWYNKEVVIEEEKDCETAVDKSVFNRRYMVEDRLGLLLENHMIDGGGKEGYVAVVEAVKNDQFAETHLYDIAVNNMYHTMEFAAEGLFQNLLEVPNLNLEKPYYSQYYNQQAVANNKLYSTTGDASLTFIRFVFVTFFNKTVQRNNGIDDLYDVVNDKQWTLEYQYELVKDLYMDKNTNDTVDDGDLFGLVTNSVTGVDPYTSAFQLNMVGRDENGRLVNVIEGNTAYFTEVITKIIELYDANGVRVLKHKADDTEFDDARQIFAEDRALFATLRLDSCENYTLRDMKSDFGVIPMPMYTEEQGQYYSYCHDLFSVFCICRRISDKRLPAVGAAMELLFSHSEDCRHNLFDIALKKKYQRTEEASQMLDIIVDNVKLDAGWIYAGALEDFALNIRSMVQNGTKNFNGIWRAQGTVLIAKIDDLQAG